MSLLYKSTYEVFFFILQGLQGKLGKPLMLAWATSLNMFKTSTVLLMNSNKNAPVIHSLFFYVLLKYFCPWSLATTPWNNEAIVSKVWNLCLCFSLSPSCCLFLVFALFVGCTFFFIILWCFCCHWQPTQGAEKGQTTVLKRFLKVLLENVSPGPYLPYTTKQHWHLSVLHSLP